MKTAEPRTSAKSNKNNSPFFSKESGGGFFSKAAGTESFFSRPGQATPSIQRKLRIGQSNDQYEKEADSVADSVVEHITSPRSTATAPMAAGNKPVSHTITPLVQNKCAECEQEDQLEKKEELQKGKLQRKPIFESNAEPPDDQTDLQRKCAHCEEEEKEHVQRKEAGSDSAAASPSVESSLSSSKGKGTSLPADVNQSMSDAFGSDFSHVRIHTDSAAARMSSQLGAQAFTHGSDIYFNEGKYSATDTAGRHLLAHELTHTVQQGAEGEKIQRDPVKCDENATSKISIDDVTNNCPHEKGKITDNPKTIYINKLKVKQNAPESILASLGSEITLPKPGSRQDNPTKQVSLWNTDVKPLVTASLEKLLDKINANQVVGDKKDSKNKYTLKLKTGKGEAVITGSFTELVNGATISKWNADGKTMAFQVEHILDYQIAGGKADDITNLMLLSAAVNNNLGSVMKEYIRSDISTILTHYNKYIAKGTLVTRSDDARDNYVIKAVGTEKIDPDIPKDEEIVRKTLTEAGTDPLRAEKVDMSVLNLKKGEFILKSNKKGGGVILPFSKKEFDIGSFKLTTNGDAEKETISKITATQVLNGSHTEDKPEIKEFDLTPVPGETKAYKAPGFGVEMAKLKLKYLSPVEFDTPDLDEGLNIEVTGRIKTPGPSFLSKHPIEVSVVGRELIIQKTFSSNDLGNVGPIKVDESSLTLSLSTKEGLGAMGMVAFSIPNTGKGSIDAKGNKAGFALGGHFEFDSKTFKPAIIEISYDSVKDKAGENPWTFKGTVGIAKGKITGINSATIKVGYENDELSLDGKADLDVPGVKSAVIKATYKEGAFNMKLDTEFDFKSKYIKDPNISVTLGSDESGWTLGITGGANIVIPNWKTIGLKVSYDKGLFDATAKVDDLKIGKYVSGSITLGATNANVDEKGEPAKTGNGKQLFLYGSGEIKVTLGENISSTLGVKLNKDGKILITGKLTVSREKLLKNDLLSFHRVIFDISTPKVPIFTIGVADIFLQINGSAEAMAKISPPMISIDVDLKETDIFNPQAFTVATKITPEIEAEAGLDFGVKFIIGAQALILAISGNIGGTLKFHIVAGAKAELDLVWSPEKGITFKHAEGSLSAGIVVSGEITGGISVDLDLFVTTINIWKKDWPLAEMKFGELGQMTFKFPIDFNESGGIIAPNTDSLKPESPYTDKSAAQQLLSDKAGGEKKVEKKPEDFRKEISGILNSLPAIGPGNPRYSQERGRHFFLNELETIYKDQSWQWLRDEWAGIEMREFYKLADDLRQPRSEKIEKSARLKQFAIDHTTVPKAEIDLLASELKLADLNTGQTPVQKKPIFESNGEEKDDPLQKKTDTGSSSQTTSVESSLKSSAGKGADLPPATRDEMESSIGSDFSDVKIHDDSNAQSMSDALRAQAFTHGSDIYFSKGKYDPASEEGKELLAHELTHVVQQEGGSVEKGKIQRDDPKGGASKGNIPVLKPGTGSQDPILNTRPNNPIVLSGSQSGYSGGPAQEAVDPNVFLPFDTTPDPWNDYMKRSADSINAVGDNVNGKIENKINSPVFHGPSGKDLMNQVTYETGTVAKGTTGGITSKIIMQAQYDFSTYKWIPVGETGIQPDPATYGKVAYPVEVNYVQTIEYYDSKERKVTLKISGNMQFTPEEWLKAMPFNTGALSPVSMLNFKGTFGSYSWHMTGSGKLQSYDFGSGGWGNNNSINQLSDIQSPQELHGKQLPAVDFTKPYLLPGQQFTSIMSYLDAADKITQDYLDSLPKATPVSGSSGSTVDLSGGTKDEKDDDSGWEVPDWLVTAFEIVGGILAAALIVGLIILIVPELAAGLVAAAALAGITLAIETATTIVIGAIFLGSFVMALIHRIKEGYGKVSFWKILGVSFLDMIGIGPIYECITNESLLTGEDLNHNAFTRSFDCTMGIAGLFGAIKGVKGLFKSPVVDPAALPPDPTAPVDPNAPADPSAKVPDPTDPSAQQPPAKAPDPTDPSAQQPPAKAPDPTDPSAKQPVDPDPQKPSKVSPDEAKVDENMEEEIADQQPDVSEPDVKPETKPEIKPDTKQPPVEMPQEGGWPPEAPKGKKPKIDAPDAAKWRYQRYRYGKYKKGAAQKDVLKPGQWMEDYFKKVQKGGRPGRRGGKLQLEAKDVLKKEGIEIVEDVNVGGRYPDGVKPGPNPKGGTDYYEVGKMLKEGIPESRERIKIDDEIKGMGDNDTVTFVDSANPAKRVTYTKGSTAKKPSSKTF
jgi:hypothetical protein